MPNRPSDEAQEGGDEDGEARDSDGRAEAVDAEPEPTQEELAREAERALDMFLRDQKVLFRQGETEFEFSIANSADTQTNVSVGAATVPRLSSYVSTLSLLARYALFDEAEINILLPFRFSERDIDFLFIEPIPGLGDLRESGIGDVQIGLRGQLLREEGRRPDMAVSLSYKADTGDGLNGSGDQSVSAKLTFVKTIDPVIFFLDFGYELTFEQDGIDRGDPIFFRFGTGFSLNDRVSYNLQFIAQRSEETSIDGVGLEGSRSKIGSLQLGVTTQMTRNVFVEPFVNVGLTDDATDMVFGVSVPF